MNLCNLVKFRRHLLFGFSITARLIINHFAGFSALVTIQTIITWPIEIGAKNTLHQLQARRMSFHVICYMASFDEGVN